MEIEQSYIKDNKNGIEYSLEDQLKDIGFVNLDEYFKLKQEWKLHSLKFNREFCQIEEVTNKVVKLLNAETPSLLTVKSDKIAIYHGDEPYDKDFCTEHNILVNEIGHHGGTIVVGKDDISFGLFLPYDFNMDFSDFLNLFASIFKKYYTDVNINNNDILINGEKVLGAAGLHGKTLKGYVTNISFSNNTDLINQICSTVPMQKTPGFLTKMTREQLEREVIKWLQ